ncbi:MAG: alpha/beta hydrolase [Haliea sp.]|uniref:alpha/beta fold hydrolase n=1 Tax=Haliea sp. TaxID=1932666 RepID=UPI000C365B2A|nr:alpha/beta hydrolase [Haliea sp.]MBM70018.1 alpha/beta hydrolase [Haliea sp.]|tara:strand:- start:44912 stop:45736 length:825 start_codon:yes stop_codon:yes gene_type:complete
MQERLESFGGAGSKLVFAHANGYPPGSYRRLLAPLAEHFSVSGYRHRPLWSREPAPARANWRQFADDLIATLEHSDGEPVWIMGHSLGGVVAMLAACKRPELFRGLVLLDPVFMPMRLALGLNLTPRSRLARIPMVRRALRRPGRFSSVQQAYAFHRDKRAYSGISDDVLWDYIRAGVRATADGDWELAYSGAWEAAVYSSLPLVWPRLWKLRLPTLGLRGEHSDILSAAGLRRWAALQPAAELDTLPGGHLFPLEHPDATARRVLDFLARQPA